MVFEKLPPVAEPLEPEQCPSTNVHIQPKLAATLLVSKYLLKE